MVDEPFTKVMTDPTATKVELLNDYDEIVASERPRSKLDRLSDYMAQLE